MTCALPFSTSFLPDSAELRISKHPNSGSSQSCLVAMAASCDDQEINSLDTSFPFQFPNDGFRDGSFNHLSFALAAAQTAPPFDSRWSDHALDRTSNDSTAISSPLTPGTPITGPKLGSRFSREVIRTLKNWLAAHIQHPYPRQDDLTLLQQRTGLNQAQLANWFANARRRGKAQGARPASPQVHNDTTSPVDIPQRPGTPAVERDHRTMNPLQRWVDSPPEHEPAHVGDIARAVASGSRSESGKFMMIT
jgi:hypothetical protein